MANVCRHRKARTGEVVPRMGIARDSRARRRSRLAWAPPHENFLLKIFAPAFGSCFILGQCKTGTNKLFRFYIAVPGVGVEPTTLAL